VYFRTNPIRFRVHLLANCCDIPIDKTSLAFVGRGQNCAQSTILAAAIVRVSSRAVGIKMPATQSRASSNWRARRRLDSGALWHSYSW